MHKNIKIIVLSVILLFSLSCSLFTSSEKPSSESIPTETMVMQAHTPSPSPAAEINTNTPTVISSTTSLNESGPFVIFKGEAGIWIANPDGGFLTQISTLEIRGDLRRAISPTEDRIAFVVRNDQGLDLVMVNIPGGEIETIANLISITPEEEANNPTSQKAFSAYAIRDYESAAWQPGDGRLLAFIGAIQGPTADLYLYNTQTKEIRQLTDGPAEAINPSWSPDGQYILHFGVRWEPPFGGAIGGANKFIGTWAAHVSDDTVVSIPKPDENFPHFLNWQNDRHYLSSESDIECDYHKLYSINILTGEKTPLMDFGYNFHIVQSPENGALLFSGSTACTNSLGEGLFILMPGQNSPRKLLEERIWEIDWLPESRVFNAYPEALFSADGNTRYDPPVYDKSYNPAVSKNGYHAWEVIENQEGRVMVQVPGGEWQMLMSGSVRELIWDPLEGKTLLIVLRDGSLYAATYPDFNVRLMGTMGGWIDQVIWLP